MQRVESNPAVTPPVTPLSKNDSCCSHTTKIALASLASLAGFFFLPPGVAFTLTAVVTVGAVVYCGDDAEPKPKIGQATRASRVAASSIGANGLNPHEPAQVYVQGDFVIVQFANIEEKNLFLKSVPQSFSDHWEVSDKGMGIVSLIPRPPSLAMDVINDLKSIYKDIKVCYIGKHALHKKRLAERRANGTALPKPQKVEATATHVIIRFASKEEVGTFTAFISHGFFDRYEDDLTQSDRLSFHLVPKNGDPLNDLITELQIEYGEDLVIIPKLA